MNASDFSKALLESAKVLDVAPSGAKERALEQLAAAVATTSGAATATAAATKMVATTAGTAKLGASAWALVAVGAIAIGAGGFAAGRFHATPLHATPAPAHAAESRSVTRRDAVAGSDRPAASAPVVITDSENAAKDVCAEHVLPERRAAVCSKRGKDVSLELRNGCAHEVDLFWVDYQCEEVFHARLAPGEAFQRLTQDGHVWRVRDHATHALLKEFVPQRVPGTPDGISKAAPRDLADVVVGPDLPIRKDDAPPPVCSGAGAPAKVKITNERDQAVSVMWVGLDCKEKYWERIEPHKSLVIQGRDADAWRIRDAKTGGVIFDVSPDAPDLMTYVSVP